MDLGIGVIGCGAIARDVHLPVLAARRDVRVAALADPDSAAVRACRRVAPTAAVCDGYHELLVWPGVNAVLIAVPSPLHAEIAVAGFSASKHVYLEKPLATSLPDARRVLDAWRSSGRIGMIGFNFRFHPQCLEMKRRLAAGEIGRLLALRTVFTTRAGARPGWAASTSQGGGPWFELAIHEIDLARFILEEELTGIRAREEDGTVTFDARTPKGVLVQGLFSMGSIEEGLIECHGTRGKLEISRYHSASVEFRACRATGVAGKMIQDLSQLAALPSLWRKWRAPSNQPSYSAAWSHFINAARGGGTVVSPDLLDGYRSLEVVETARGTL